MGEMHKVYKAVYAEENIPEATVNEFVKWYKNLSELWQDKMENDCWKIVIVSKALGESYVIDFYEVDRTIILNTYDINIYEDASQLISRAFAGYVNVQYEKVEQSAEYQNIVKNYKNEVKVLNDLTGCGNEIFAGLVNIYLELVKDGQMFCTDLLVSSLYITKWMNGDFLFDPLKDDKYKINVYIGHDVTIASAGRFTDSIEKIPESLANALNDKGCVFILNNDLDLLDQSLIIQKGKIADEMIIIKTYEYITDVLYYRIGMYVYYHMFSSKFLNTAKKKIIFMLEKGKLENVYIDRERFSDEIGMDMFYSIAIQQIIMKPKLLKRTLPQTYKFLIESGLFD